MVAYRLGDACHFKTRSVNSSNANLGKDAKDEPGESKSLPTLRVISALSVGSGKDNCLLPQQERVVRTEGYRLRNTASKTGRDRPMRKPTAILLAATS